MFPSRTLIINPIVIGVVDLNLITFFWNGSLRTMIKVYLRLQVQWLHLAFLTQSTKIFRHLEDERVEIGTVSPVNEGIKVGLGFELEDVII